jgi:hypothetical protein
MNDDRVLSDEASPGGEEVSGPEVPDAGLLGLVLIARFHQIPVTPL